MSGPVFLATGPYGLVGRSLFAVFPGLVPLDAAPAPAGAPGDAAPPVDITDARAVAGLLSAVRRARGAGPMLLVHLAAATDTKSRDADLFRRVNVEGTANVLAACRAEGAHLIHISTDYVFGGEGRKAAPYTEADRPRTCPPGPYAASKFEAERLVLDAPETDGARIVARIAFPYGGEGGGRAGLAGKFAQRFEDARRAGQPVKLFDDQTICPSYIPDIAQGLKRTAAAILGGTLGGDRTFHLVGAPTTPFGFGELVRRVFGFDDVALERASVAGAGYAENLWLSHQATARRLGWEPTPLADALKELKARRTAP